MSFTTTLAPSLASFNYSIFADTASGTCNDGYLSLYKTHDVLLELLI